MNIKNLIQKIRLKLFHPPYYCMIESSNPESHLVFINKVEKSWGMTTITPCGYTSDMLAQSYVNEQNQIMKSLYGNHPIYEGKIIQKSSSTLLRKKLQEFKK